MTNGASAHIERDIVFGRGGDSDLLLDVYHPVGSSKRTAIVHLHGGGFTGGSKANNELNSLALADRGYTSISVGYRLAPGARWPAQIHDTKAAIRWTRANAERLSIDPDKIIVAGYSAGGTLALVAAGSDGVSELEGGGGNPGIDSSVAACIAYYSAAQRTRRESGEDPLMGLDASDEAYQQVSGVSYAKTAKPTILFHSVADDTVPVEASLRLFEAYRDAGVQVEMHIFDGLPHVFERRHTEFLGPTMDMCDLFLDRLIVNPRVFPPFGGGARAR